MNPGLSLLALLLISCSSWGQPATPSPGATEPPDIYRRTCGYCHEPTYSNDRFIAKSLGPTLRGRFLPPAFTEYMVRHGKGAMPPFTESEVSQKELLDLGKWILESSAPPASGAKP
ncbi:cytochrome c [Pseudomonas sp. G5(2012)]|uniref:c-type cytochrome n=1 Tax=Pseudomonas sp. G5(2012) TaxID=1268068 RepID=UPI003524EDD4